MNEIKNLPGVGLDPFPPLLLPLEDDEVGTGGNGDDLFDFLESFLEPFLELLELLELFEA
jgi:hypothetical protein